MSDTTTANPATNRARKMAREPKTDAANIAMPAVAQAPEPTDTAAAVPAKPLTKAALVEAMLARVEGASLNDLCEATGWLPHTRRAFLTGLRKKSRVVVRSKHADGATIYSLSSAAEAAMPDAATRGGVTAYSIAAS